MRQHNVIVDLYDVVYGVRVIHMPSENCECRECTLSP